MNSLIIRYLFISFLLCVIAIICICYSYKEQKKIAARTAKIEANRIKLYDLKQRYSHVISLHVYKNYFPSKFTEIYQSTDEYRYILEILIFIEMLCKDSINQPCRFLRDRTILIARYLFICIMRYDDMWRSVYNDFNDFRYANSYESTKRTIRYYVNTYLGVNSF